MLEIFAYVDLWICHECEWQIDAEWWQMVIPRVGYYPDPHTNDTFFFLLTFKFCNFILGVCREVLPRPPDEQGYLSPHWGPQIRVRNWKLFFIFLNQNICCGYSKEPSGWDSSYEHPIHMFKLIEKKIYVIAILSNFFCLTGPMPHWLPIHWVLKAICVSTLDFGTYCIWAKNKRQSWCIQKS